MSVLNHSDDDTKTPDMMRSLILARLEALCTKKNLDPLKDLFWKDLTYQRINKPLSFRNWKDATSVQDYLDSRDPLTLFATNEQKDFHIIYIHLTSSELPLTHERPIITNLLRDHPNALFVFSNSSQDKWHFVNVMPEDKDVKRRIFRRITVSQEEQLRTASERLALLDIAALEDASPLEILAQHAAAFDVTAVTKEFFDIYQKLFRDVQKDLYAQTGDLQWAHDYALLFLNRCMFLYFIQRKGWLGGDKRFLRTFWHDYNRLQIPEKETFFDQWLQVLFFQAFNRAFDKDDESYFYFPSRIKKILDEAPFLNGGLFSRGPLDKRNDLLFTISDTLFQRIFQFFEGYNFTIAEDSPLDQEVAVDPEMIGRVYESLVNVSSAIDERGDVGIFYTPRTEIDLMCRLTLVDYLANNHPDIPKNLLYDVVFALELHEKALADEALHKLQLWRTISPSLRMVTVLDPACGSGAFLVGMLRVLDDLQARANHYYKYPENENEDDYERRKRIIGRSLYGVDVMAWAVQVVELRLWLILVVDTDIPLNKLHDRSDPILPYFTFKLRYGDSLVQQIGGVPFAYQQVTNGISSILQRRLSDLKHEKELFYRYDVNSRFKTCEAMQAEERELFIAIIQERERKLKGEMIPLQNNLALEHPSWIVGSSNEEDKPIRLEVLTWQRQLAEKEKALSEAQNVQARLRSEQQIPFVWDISFVEIFSGASQGFDIVIGNPPYVRQENISDPLRSRHQITPEKKRLYKQTLAETIHQAFADFFLYKTDGRKAAHELDAKSDLYIYFYLHGLRLLNPKGSFCFITSNSWLDVGYGAMLQEFLLQYCKVKLIIDNAAKRSFATADVNTVITLLAAPGSRDKAGQDTKARFVLFTVNFEQTLFSDVFKQIENTDQPTTTPFYRLYSISQRDLLSDGSTIQKMKAPGKPSKRKASDPMEQAFTQLTHYTGNKWGGKYLRAPDIYWTLMQKGKAYLKNLGDIAEIRYGIKTGANDFFYLDDEKVRQWQIEECFLRPVIKSPTECTSILIQPNGLKSQMFFCQKTEAELKGTAALAYIRWGESQGYHKNASVSGRTRWWSFPIEAANSIFVKEAHNTSAVFYNPDRYPVDCRLYYADLPTTTLVYLNSAIGALLFEIYNRAGLGRGARSMMVSDYALVPALCYIAEREEDAALVMRQVYDLAARKFVLSGEHKLMRSGSNLFDEPWKTLDDFIFDIFQLTQIEREAVYQAAINLVEARLKKAALHHERSDPGGRKRARFLPPGSDLS